MPKALWSDKRKFIWVLTLVLMSAFFLTSWSSYQVAHHSLSEQIESNTLPLTSDNIYSEIQQDLLRPIFISSLMAHDTFLRDWALSDESDAQPMVRYLKELQERFGTVTSFYVSEKTGRYYHSSGVLKTVSAKSPEDAWYFRVRDLPVGEDFEINIDTDTADRSKTTVFVNYRVYDFNKKLIGVTGVGLAVDKVRELIEKYQERYSRSVYFIDRQGRVALHGKNYSGPETIQADPALAPLATQILTSPGGSYQYERQDQQVYLNSRLVPEFKWYLMVEQASHAGEGKLQQTLWGNLLLSGLVTLGILVIANLTLGRYQRRIEQMAATDKLTGMISRQVFETTFEHLVAQARRQQQHVSVILFDIDLFKQVNDHFGHNVGDMVIRKVAQTMLATVRQSDVVCRWGGEEFLVLLPDCDGLAASVLGEKIRAAVAALDIQANGETIAITLSGGVAEYQSEGSVVLLNRADQALYRAKAAGRNRLVMA